MCCFSGIVRSVSSTRIFARMSEPGRQALVYQMSVLADKEVAMILPLPVAPDTREDALKFINLNSYPEFFNDLQTGFPSRATLSGVTDASNGTRSKTALKVETVGSFEASFVPSSGDFDRLDPRFSIPKATWDKLPLYQNYGFAVFKLRKGGQTVHPMAFTFPTRHPAKLFFPTVHIHDGQVHAKEEFDHELYCQVNRGGMFAMMAWEESASPANGFSEPAKSEGILIGDKHVYRNNIIGMRKNEDIVLGTA